MAKNREISRVALYCRVSTTDQATGMQVEDLKRMATARGWTVVTTVEEKASGRKHRPARQKLIAAAKAGEFDAIMVWKLNRWGRSTGDLVTSIRDLDAAGVAFISLKDSIDMSTPAGRLMLGILSSIAEFEADNIRENVLTGLAHAARHGTRSGKAIGRPSVAQDRRVEVRALRTQGLSLTAIAAKTGLGYGSVHRLVAAAPARHK
jgi:putative DNA-invertase from lambdoid prophage Rac